VIQQNAQNQSKYPGNMQHHLNSFKDFKCAKSLINSDEVQYEIISPHCRFIVIVSSN